MFGAPFLETRHYYPLDWILAIWCSNSSGWVVKSLSRPNAALIIMRLYALYALNTFLPQANILKNWFWASLEGYTSLKIHTHQLLAYSYRQ